MPDAALGRELLTRDVVATAQGFLAAGVKCVVVLDSHDGAIDPGPLTAMGVPVVTPANDPHWTWPFLGSVVEKASFAALIGYHSRADQQGGFRPHTINDSVRELQLNGVVRGEVAHAIIGFGAFQVPVVLVSGDMNATAEAAELVPTIEQVTVRWRDSAGAVQFLTSSEAGTRLRAAAYRAANTRGTPYRPAAPITLSIRTHSTLLMQGQAKTLPEAFTAHAKAAGWDLRLIEGFDFASTMRTEQDRVQWTAPNALAAYVSVAKAASHLRGPDNFDQVGRGYQAYAAGRYQEALTAYAEALRVNPYDVATHCRMGAAHQKLGQLPQARQWFRSGFEQEDEIAEGAMKSWCALGLAQTELAAGNVSAAQEAANRVLALPDVFERHAQARKVLAEAAP